jgi:hypothetical protein
MNLRPPVRGNNGIAHIYTSVALSSFGGIIITIILVGGIDPLFASSSFHMPGMVGQHMGMQNMTNQIPGMVGQHTGMQNMTNQMPGMNMMTMMGKNMGMHNMSTMMGQHMMFMQNMMTLLGKNMTAMQNMMTLMAKQMMHHH